jgi:hypothetical protein
MTKQSSDRDDNRERNKKIGECAGHIHVALHSYADMHRLNSVDRLQALIAVLQNLASTIRESTNASS